MYIGLGPFEIQSSRLFQYYNRTVTYVYTVSHSSSAIPQQGKLVYYEVGIEVTKQEISMMVV